ncbi:MAG: UDP-2,3-diacylglucosamine diphosphatase [Saprospiraceae bacterium]|nr:UDP-2,3-diacylglucosamine diphosphatase [Saprospiraceae bacterium]
MGSNIYFASDFHLGVDALLTSSEREKKIVRWLDFIAPDAKELLLVGDVFDYWFEYNKVIPKGYSRFFGKIAELVDAGISISYFTGNHDMWMFRYMTEEFGIPIYRSPIKREWNGKEFLIGHGDGLGPGDNGYKMIKKIFENKFCQWAYGKIHPDPGIALMKYFSTKSRAYTGDESNFSPPDEWLVMYSESIVKQSDLDYLIFGHRHLPIDYLLSNNYSRYINLGDWLYFCSYAVFNGKDLEIRFFESEYETIFGNTQTKNKEINQNEMI